MKSEVQRERFLIQEEARDPMHMRDLVRAMTRVTRVRINICINTSLRYVTMWHRTGMHVQWGLLSHVNI